eukprot:581770-Rhodomonas_salina.1
MLCDALTPRLLPPPPASAKRRTTGCGPPPLRVTAREWSPPPIRNTRKIHKTKGDTIDKTRTSNRMSPWLSEPDLHSLPRARARAPLLAAATALGVRAPPLEPPPALPPA